MAALCTRACAATGPSDIMPGVNCLKATAPMPAPSRVLLISAEETRVL